MSDPRAAAAAERDGPLVFAAAPVADPGRVAARTWKILIVDDEEEVHVLTRLVLRDYTFEGRGLEMLSAHSGAAARQVLAAHPDVALVLLDVVMEQEDSGLRLVQHIRGDLGNRNVRIILRTGQPGQAPETEVVARYDINDYKAKTELTSQKLYTTVTSALRSWRDLQTIERSRHGMQRVIEASGGLFEWRSRRRFTKQVLHDLVGLLDPAGTAAPDAAGSPVAALVARNEGDGFVVCQAYGRFAGLEERSLAEVDLAELAAPVMHVLATDRPWVGDEAYARLIRADNGRQALFLVADRRGLGGLEASLVRLFMTNAATAFQNVNLSLDLIESQKEIIQTLGDVVETRSRETAHHVLRVGEMAHLLASLAGCAPDLADVLRVATPMHDVGKVGIPDAILNKPGRLTPDEFAVMRTHTTIGYEILSRSERPLMRAAAEIALTHHEAWDGSGYPAGLAGEEIPLAGRITAVVDVFDAMVNRRVYREAMDLAEVVAHIAAGRGTRFDPRLVDVFLAHRDRFIAVVRENPDHTSPRRRLAVAD
ncbi:DUF3369 domain-containing protein [bacterium]|nr:DUF3369 domain-containing protein [bacterium]